MMMQKVCLALALATAAAAGDCKASTLDFVMLEGEASHAAIEDDIRKDLAVVGIEVVPCRTPSTSGPPRRPEASEPGRPPQSFPSPPTSHVERRIDRN